MLKRREILRRKIAISGQQLESDGGGVLGILVRRLYPNCGGCKLSAMDCSMLAGPTTMAKPDGVVLLGSWMFAEHLLRHFSKWEGLGFEVGWHSVVLNLLLHPNALIGVFLGRGWNGYLDAITIIIIIIIIPQLCIGYSLGSNSWSNVHCAAAFMVDKLSWLVDMGLSPLHKTANEFNPTHQSVLL
jgi:hypothetical protein